jgi:hypothetical protein
VEDETHRTLASWWSVFPALVVLAPRASGRGDDRASKDNTLFEPIQQEASPT